MSVEAIIKEDEEMLNSLIEKLKQSRKSVVEL